MARNTKLTHRDVETRLGDIYSTAEICKFTSAEINARVRSFMDLLNERTPGGARRYSQEFVGYARGFARALDRRIMEGPRCLVEFVYRDANGVIYSTHATTDHAHTTEEFYSTGRGSELGNLEAAHVWKGTDKPFTPWAIPNVESAKFRAREEVKKDNRYSVTLEGAGHTHPRYVVRFCGEWEGMWLTETEAWDQAAEHKANRDARLSAAHGD
jgi:hypothetical protein